MFVFLSTRTAGLEKESAVVVLSGCQEVFMYVSIFTFVVLVVSKAVDLTGGTVLK